MDIRMIPVGRKPPEDINAVIEIPMNSDPIKYELSKKSSAMFVDRFLHTPMRYPDNYGFIPNTLSEDGDPIDVIVMTRIPVAVGSVIRSCPVGVFLMEDEKGRDEKIITVPHPSLNPYYKDIKSYTELPEMDIQKIENFFSHYKDLEKGKWVNVLGWQDAEAAKKLILEGIERAREL
ncbi:MAG: inorganic diphosphatase [Alphaproteobacteria bacterium]